MVADSDGFVVVLVDTVKGVYWLFGGKRGKRGQTGDAEDRSPPEVRQNGSPVPYWYTSTGLLYISAMACISMWLPWQLFFLFLLMYVVKSSVT